MRIYIGLCEPRDVVRPVTEPKKNWTIVSINSDGTVTVKEKGLILTREFRVLASNMVYKP